MEWKEYNICQLCDTISETYKGKSNSVVLINTSDVLEGKVLNHKRVPNKGLKGQFKKTFKKNDILYSEIRPANKRFAYINFSPNDYIASTKLMVLRSKPIVSSHFLFQILKSEIVLKNLQMLAESRSGTFPQITYSELSNVRVKVPPLPVQDKIVGILSALDSKIENNNKINANLEAQAQALFKSWFVDFTPFKDQPFVDSELGPIPQGWKVGKLGDYCECVLGGTPSRSESSYWNGDIAWINSGEVNKFRICTPSEFITSKGLDNSSTKLLPKKTTVLAITGATLGQISILEIDSCANQSVIGIKQNDNMPYEFIYPTVKVNIKRLLNLQTGGAQQHINKNNVQNLFIVYPPKFILQKYKEHTKCIYSKISTLCVENQRLAALRDTLLPKLMSGEIKL